MELFPWMPRFQAVEPDHLWWVLNCFDQLCHHDQHVLHGNWFLLVVDLDALLLLAPSEVRPGPIGCQQLVGLCCLPGADPAWSPASA